MPWIEQDDSLELSNVIKIMSLRPEAMKAVQESNRVITFGGSALSRVEEEAIATVTSVVNKYRF